MVDKELKKQLLIAQKNEITEHFIYAKLAQATKDPANKETLQNISKDELKHYHIWKKYTDEEVRPSRLRIWKYYLISRFLGLTFGVKLMECGEGHAKLAYEMIAKVLPEAEKIMRDEDKHEKALIGLIDEERLKYVGSMVLGLNDALVELTGALAGFTLALQNTRMIALVGMITGIAASLSMAASEYLSTKSEEGEKTPLKASVYTGLAYVLTVLILVFPYLVFTNYFLCLAIVIFNAVIIILFFTFYISVARDYPFKKRFIEMVTISLGVALLSFGIGFIVRQFFKIDI